MENRTDIWEYSIYLKNGEEYFTENKNEMEDLREEREEEIENIYLKQYIYNKDTEDYEEEYCEVIK